MEGKIQELNQIQEHLHKMIWLKKGDGFSYMDSKNFHEDQKT